MRRVHDQKPRLAYLVLLISLSVVLIACSGQGARQQARPVDDEPTRPRAPLERFNLQEGSSTEAPTEQTPALGIQEGPQGLPGVTVSDQGNRGLASLGSPHRPYNTSPPTSGPHVESVIVPHIYLEQAPDELQVHNLEHGHILVQYDCPEGCPDLVERLMEVVQEHLDRGRKVIMAPYAGIRTPDGNSSARIALTAWTRIDTFDTFDRQRLRAFIEAFEGIDHHALP